jgi:hypothetical protein
LRSAGIHPIRTLKSSRTPKRGQSRKPRGRSSLQRQGPNWIRDRFVKGASRIHARAMASEYSRYPVAPWLPSSPQFWF